MNDKNRKLRPKRTRKTETSADHENELFDETMNLL